MSYVEYLLFLHVHFLSFCPPALSFLSSFDLFIWFVRCRPGLTVAMQSRFPLVEIDRTRTRTGSRVDQRAKLVEIVVVATGGPFRTLANPFRISFACIMTRVLSCLVWKPLFNSVNARRYNKPENVIRFLLQCAQTCLPYLWKERPPFPSMFSIVHFVYSFLSLFFIVSNFCTNFMRNI